MNFAKALMVVFGLSLASAQAASAGPILHSLYCTSTNSGPDHGLVLSINFDLALKMHFASLSEETIAGPRPIAHYDGLKVIDRRPVDGALTYKGRGFTISVTSRMNPQGRAMGRMTARTLGSNSHVITSDMSCMFPK